MAGDSKSSRGGKAEGRARARIRAFRRDDVGSQIERRLFALGLGPETIFEVEPDVRLARRLAQALRAERRAARAGAAGYDPVRHLVLVRFARAFKRRSRPAGDRRRR